jgi:hypothetical protein
MSSGNDLNAKQRQLLESAKLARVKRPRATSANLSSADKFVRLKALECFPDILAMCNNNVKPKEIADFIRREAKFYNLISIDTITRMVRDFITNEFPKYRTALDVDGESAPNTMEPELISSQHPHHAIAVDRVERINVLQELESLYNIQKARIITAYSAESQKGAKTGNMNRSIGTEIKVATDILSKIHNVREDLNLNKTNLLPSSDSDESLSPVTRSLMDNPSRRGAVLEMAERLANLDAGLAQRIVVADKRIKGQVIEDAEIDGEGGPLGDISSLEDNDE